MSARLLPLRAASRLNSSHLSVPILLYGRKSSSVSTLDHILVIKSALKFVRLL
jgi:hypothetical protein